MGERVLGYNWDLGFLRVFLCTIVSPYFIVKSLQLRGRRQIAEPHKYCLVRVIVFCGVCFLYLFCFSQVGILFKFPTHAILLYVSMVILMSIKFSQLKHIPRRNLILRKSCNLIQIMLTNIYIYIMILYSPT